MRRTAIPGRVRKPAPRQSAEIGLGAPAAGLPETLDELLGEPARRRPAVVEGMIARGTRAGTGGGGASLEIKPQRWC